MQSVCTLYCFNIVEKYYFTLLLSDSSLALIKHVFAGQICCIWELYFF